MFTTAVLTVMSQAGAELVTHLSMHTGGDVSSSADELAIVRAPVTWDNTDGVLSGAATFEGGTPGVSPTRIGYWSAAVGGVYRGGQFRADGAPGFSPTGHLEVTVVEAGFSV